MTTTVVVEIGVAKDTYTTVHDTYTTVHSWRVLDGRLVLVDGSDQRVAEYAAGRWVSVSAE